MNQPQISCPQISQMNADGENHRDDPLLVRLADSAILDVAIRWSSAFSRLTDHPKGGNQTRDHWAAEASKWSELRLGCHPETPVIEPCPISQSSRV